VTPIRLTIVGLFIATAGVVLSLLGSELWFVGTTAGCLCSTAGVLWSARRATRISLTDYGIEISRRAREQVPITSGSAWLLDHRDDREREFEPFCECPKCGLTAFHLFSAPRQQTDSRPIWQAGPGTLWVEDDYEVSVWDRAGTYRVRQEGRMVTKKRVATVVDRECLSCRREWTEKVS
jgi:hypothetical protein